MKTMARVWISLFILSRLFSGCWIKLFNCNANIARLSFFRCDSTYFRMTSEIWRDLLRYGSNSNHAHILSKQIVFKVKIILILQKKLSRCGKTKLNLCWFERLSVKDAEYRCSEGQSNALRCFQKNLINIGHNVSLCKKCNNWKWYTIIIARLNRFHLSFQLEQQYIIDTSLQLQLPLDSARFEFENEVAQNNDRKTQHMLYLWKAEWLPFNSSPQCKKSSLRHHFRQNFWKLGS